MAVKRRYSTRLLMSVAAVGAAGGVLVVALNYALLFWVPPSTIAYSIYAMTIPFWYLGPYIALALFRMPGVGLIAAAIGGIVNFVTPYGLAQFGNAIVAGILLEVPFAIVGYRRWSDRYYWFAFPLAALLQSTAYFLVCWFGGVILPAEFQPWLAIVTVVASLASAIAVTSLSLAVARRLRRAGVGMRASDATPA